MDRTLLMNKIDVQVKYCLKSGTPQQRKPIMHNWGRKLKHHKVGFWEISKLGCNCKITIVEKRKNE